MLYDHKTYLTSEMYICTRSVNREQAHSILHIHASQLRTHVPGRDHIKFFHDSMTTCFFKK